MLVDCFLHALLMFSANEDERHTIGMPVKPAPAVQQAGKKKDDAYDQFMREMENLL